MKIYEATAIIIVIVALAVGIGAASYYFFGPDNPIEEASEEIIKIETGIDLDLSPRTLEKK